MAGAIVITVLALISALIVLGALLLVNRPHEGWRAWLTAALRDGRRQGVQWVEADADEDVGDLRTLAQLSEPGSAYVGIDDERRLRRHFPSRTAPR
ncbi:MAG TPA: hypothetical protein VK024_00235 [Actinomycetaceae bacterium]|nr:hypothetical protein [Actinomycetaceae bacterium]